MNQKEQKLPLLQKFKWGEVSGHQVVAGAKKLRMCRNTWCFFFLKNHNGCPEKPTVSIASKREINVGSSLASVCDASFASRRGKTLLT